MSIIRVPFGIDEQGVEVPATSAIRGIRYVCPDCQGELTPKLGPIRVKHFAHRVEPVVCDFQNETEEHYRAKMMIARAVNERAAVKFLRSCPWCEQSQPYPLPSGVVRATVEHLLTTRHRADVALLDERDDVVAVVEVLMHHEVDDEKSAALAARGIPWVEIGALKVLESPEPTWPLRRDHLPPAPSCGQCSMTREIAVEAIAKAIAERLPVKFVRPCPKCREPWLRPIPDKVADVFFGYEVTSQIQVGALLDIERAPVALFELAIADRVDPVLLEGMKAGGLPWAIISAEHLINQSEPVEWHLALDGFQGTACRSCRLAQQRREEQDLRIQEQEQLKAAYKAKQLLQGPLRLEVACPRPGFEAVSTVGVCAACPYFLDAEPDGILCYGSSEQVRLHE